jgi:hypothetical protein
VLNKLKTVELKHLIFKSSFKRQFLTKGNVKTKEGDSMLFKALKPKVFTDLMETLKDKLSETLLHFHTDSIKIRATDHSKSFIAYVDLNGSTLDEYSCESYQQVGVNVAKLWTVMKNAMPGDILQMTHGQEGKSILQISIIDQATNSVKLSTDYVTYDCDEDTLSEIPENISFNDCFSMKSDKFYRDLKTLEHLECEHVKLRQCRGPGGKGNRLQMIGMNSDVHRNPTINTDEAPLKDIQKDALVSGSSQLLNSLQQQTPSQQQQQQQNLNNQRKELEEIELVFDLKKLTTFAKAKCLDQNVGIHLDERNFLVLQYNVDIYGVVRFVVKSMNVEESGLAYDEEDEDQAPRNGKRRRNDSDDENDVDDDVNEEEVEDDEDNE